MRHFLIIFCSIFFLQATAQEKSFTEFYKKNKEQAEVSLNIPGFVAKFFVSESDANTDEFEVFLKKARNYKILVFNNHVSPVKKNFKRFIKDSKLKSLVRIKDGKNRVAIFYKESKNFVRELIISTHSENDELVLLGLKTKLTKDELAAMVKSTKTSIASN